MDDSTQDDRRKHPRFSDRALAGVTVTLAPYPPLYGEPATGYLIDLSAGGMALLLTDLIPKNVFLRLTMLLPDGFQLESVVKVRRIVQQGRANHYLHGLEFLNLDPEAMKRVDAMGRDILACNGRTQKKQEPVCVSTCGLYSFCKRPERVSKNVTAEIINFNEVTPMEYIEPVLPLMQEQATTSEIVIKLDPHEDQKLAEEMDMKQKDKSSWKSFKAKFESTLKEAA